MNWFKKISYYNLFDQAVQPIRKHIFNLFRKKRIKPNMDVTFSKQEHGIDAINRLQVSFANYGDVPYPIVTGTMMRNKDMIIRVYFPQKLNDPKWYNVLNHKLSDTIRHELEHSKAPEAHGAPAPVNTLRAKDWENYYLNPGEIEAHVVGLYHKSKKQRIPFWDVLKQFINDIKFGFNNNGVFGEEVDKLVNNIGKSYKDYAQKRFPILANASSNDKMTKLAAISGEYWIDDSGNALFTDVDIGDYSHESYVIETVQMQYIEDADDWEEFKENIVQNHIEENPQDVNISPDDILAILLKNMGMTDDEFLIAEGMGDARKFAMKYWGWKRLEGNNVETWTLTNSDLNTIATGLWDAFDEVVESETFNIYIYSNQKWFNDVPWAVIESANVAVIREFALHYAKTDILAGHLAIL